MLRIIHLFFVALIVLPSGYVFADSSKISKDPVEIVAGGKIYPSLHAYKLQQLQDDLGVVLSLGQLREFSREEISAVIREIQTQPPVMARLPAADARITQIEETLKNYNAQHRDEPPLRVDPVKVKTIIIKPSSQDRLPDVQKTDER